MPAHHTLKTHPAIFAATRRGDKMFEVRKDDRAFQTGDQVTLVYHDAEPPTFLGAAAPVPWGKTDDDRLPMDFRITFVLRGGQYGVEPGFVAFGLERLPQVAP